MKYKLVKPDLNSVDLARLNFYADYIGYIFKFNYERGSALFETHDKDIGYIQQNKFGRLFIVWKSTESIEYIDQKIDICIKLHQCNIIGDRIVRKDIMLGIHRLIGHEVTYKMYKNIIKPRPQWRLI